MLYVVYAYLSFVLLLQPQFAVARSTRYLPAGQQTCSTRVISDVEVEVAGSTPNSPYVYDGTYELKTGFTPEENYLQSTTQLYDGKYVFFVKKPMEGANAGWRFSTGTIDNSKSYWNQPGLEGGYDTENNKVSTNPTLAELSLGIDGVSADNSWGDVTSTVDTASDQTVSKQQALQLHCTFNSHMH